MLLLHAPRLSRRAYKLSANGSNQPLRGQAQYFLRGASLNNSKQLVKPAAPFHNLSYTADIEEALSNLNRRRTQCR